MSQPEQDANRCKTLRGNVRNTKREISAAAKSRTQMYARLAELRSRRSELAGKIKNLEIARGALVAGSGTPGIAGIAFGATEAAVSARLSVLESQYNEVNQELTSVGARFDDYKLEIHRLNEQLRDFGREMNQLNCVSDY